MNQIKHIGEKNMIWNAQLYEKFSMERLQPALDLINRIPQGQYSRIIDIGCGTGMSTFPLEERFTDAEIIGVDASEEMLKKAREGSNKIKWYQRDCSKKLNDLGKFDLIFSNAFLQWIHNQEEFLAHISTILNEKGAIAFQVPNYDNMAVKKCVDIVKSPYKKRFEEVEKGMCHNRTMSEYYDILCEYFSEVTIWQTNYAYIMDSYEAIINFMSATGIRPYLQRLNSDEQIIFKEELVKELKKVYPVQKNGKIIFTFERIEFTAKHK